MSLDSIAGLLGTIECLPAVERRRARARVAAALDGPAAAAHAALGLLALELTDPVQRDVEVIRVPDLVATSVRP